MGSMEIQSSAHNHSSSMENSGVVSSFIKSECSAGRLLGSLPPSPLVHVSPIGLVPKNDQPGSWRMIVDLSHLQISSVDDAIPPVFFSPNTYSLAMQLLLSVCRIVTPS